ncbi:MAG TPA: response regulator [Bacillota bacterium]|nr:response regulator [Bacillota bacterium]
MKNRILVVDDQPGIRLLLNDILTSEGYHVTTAKTGKEVYEHLDANRFDLLILDYKLPIMNGIEVLQQIERAGIRVPVIIITGVKETVQNDMQVIDLDIELLAKPFNVEDVCALVEKMLTNEG